MHVHRLQYFWFENDAYPGLRGEYLLGDLTEAHPYRNTYFASMPPVMYLLGYKRMISDSNAYSRPPILQTYDSRNTADLTGKIFDTRYLVLTSDEVAHLFKDAARNDYRRNTSILPDLGSRL